MKKKLLLTIISVGISTQASAVGVGAWVGYNFAAGVDLATCEANKGATGECSKGGIALGGDLWLFGIPALPVKFGLGAAYIPVSHQKYVAGTVGSGGGSGNIVTYEISTKYIPVYAEVRLDLMGFFGGVTAGYGLSVSSATTSTTSNSFAAPTTPSGSFGLGGFAGYGIGLGPVSIEGGARVFGLSGSLNIMPFVGVKLEI